MQFRIVLLWAAYPRLFYYTRYSQRKRRNLRPLEVFRHFWLNFFAFPNCTETPLEAQAISVLIQKMLLREHVASGQHDESVTPKLATIAEHCNTFSGYLWAIRSAFRVLEYKNRKRKCHYFLQEMAKIICQKCSFRNSPKSTVRDVFPNLSYINCLVHLYVEILQFFRLSILLWVVRMVCVSPFWTGVLGETETAVGIQTSFT